MHTRRHFLGGTLCFAALTAAGLPANTLSPDAMRADLALLHAAWRALHPGLYRYLTPAALDARFAAAQRWAGRPRSLGDFFLALARLSAAIRCGHSYPNPVNQSDAVLAQLSGGRDRVPFTFRWLDGRMIATDGALPPGTEVAAIDGVPAARLLKALLPLARADGGNDAKRVALMEVRAGERYQAFDVYRPLLFPPPRPGEVALRLRDGRALRLAAQTEAERRPGGEPPSDRNWRFAIREGVGVLTMPDWAFYDSKWDWRAFLDASCDRLIAERARGLVVDLRGNEGGLDCGWPLLERLIAAPLPLPRARRLTRYRRVPETLAPYCDTWDKSFRDWGDKVAGPDERGFYRQIDDSEDVALAPRGPRFAGPVAVLGDATNSSATFQFQAAVKAARLATIVGAPSGGNRRGINGGAYFFFRLPRTGLEMDIPLIGYFPEGPLPPDAGIVPDIPVRETAADIAAGRDPVMAAALAHLARQAGASSAGTVASIQPPPSTRSPE